jgi:hypothetical protein
MIDFGPPFRFRQPVGPERNHKYPAAHSGSLRITADETNRAAVRSEFGLVQAIPCLSQEQRLTPGRNIQLT